MSGFRFLAVLTTFLVFSPACKSRSFNAWAEIAQVASTSATCNSTASKLCCPAPFAPYELQEGDKPTVCASVPTSPGAVPLEMQGPFSQQMIDRCIASSSDPSSAAATCRGAKWNFDFAKSLRGTATCPAGTRFQDQLKNCIETRPDGGLNAFGPFPTSAVDKCGTSQACRSMRVDANYLASLQGITLQSPVSRG